MNRREEQLVSVITPVFNMADSVSACIESVRRQPYGRWEQIVVDDGSEDDTWQRLNECALAESRLRILRQEHGGMAKARNAALARANGTLIALLDADDLAMSERLSAPIAHMADHPEIDVLGGGHGEFTVGGRVLGGRTPVTDHETLVKDMWRRTPFFVSTVTARRRFFEETGGFNESRWFRRSEDIDLWFRGAHRFRYGNLTAPLAWYRRKERLSMRDALYSCHARLRAMLRANKPHLFWYALRPLLAVIAGAAGLYSRKPYAPLSETFPSDLIGKRKP